jgi:isopenicillin N synthase-like dioxygenase
MLAKDELGCLYVGQQNHWPNILEIKPAFVVMIGDFFLRIK